jgi:hypothetical protein
MNSVIRMEPLSGPEEQAAGWNIHLFKTFSVQCVVLIYPKGFDQALF